MISYKNNKINETMLYTPECFTIFFNFYTNFNSYNITNNNLSQGQTLDKVQSILIDNSQSAVETIIKCESTGQIIKAPANSMLSTPILMSENELITVTNASTSITQVIIILTNRMLSAGQYLVGVQT